MTNKEIIQRLTDDMKLRGHSPYTMDDYARHVEMFLEFSNKPVELRDERDVKEFLLHLKEVRKLKDSSINGYNSALRFLYGVTLNKPLNVWQIPRCKQQRSLPELLTKEEIALLLEHTSNPMYRAMFMTIYGSGLRVSEAIGIKVCDIDSVKMRIFIRKGKGGRDRYATLSQKALEELRSYWKIVRPTEFLFLTRLKKKPTPKSVNNALQASLERAGIKKNVTAHTLRHCFATHLLEDDANLFHIKKLLGHRSIRSTVWYLHFADNAAFHVTSPLDSLEQKND